MGLVKPRLKNFFGNAESLSLRRGLATPPAVWYDTYGIKREEGGSIVKDKMNAAEAKTSLWTLFFLFFRIGLFTFGGGYAMIPLIEETVVKKHGWLTADELLDMLAVADSTPGPVAINCATYVGYRRRGVRGAICATAGVVLPSLIILFAISLFFDRFLEWKPVAAAFQGIKVAVAVLILRAAWSLLKKLPHTAFAMTLTVLTVLGVLAINFFAFRFSTLYFILVGAVLGLIATGVSRLQTRKRGERT